jgi:hypothetical protein
MMNILKVGKFYKAAVCLYFLPKFSKLLLNIMINILKNGKSYEAAGFYSLW